MEKIRLKNQMEIAVEGGMTPNCFTTVVVGYEGMKELYNSLTEENLSESQVLNDAGIICSVLKNKKMSKTRTFEAIEGTENLKVTVNLEDIDEKEIQLNQLSANTDYLVMISGM